MKKTKMTENPIAKDVGSKKEDGCGSSSSRQWTPCFKNPRIVRVSRSYGGKDRHSKVCTVRGLRDRRIRLSVPTAIQLYDLQDRLGLSQPSKVIDWLIHATKHEIDNLPPLPMLPTNFLHYFHQPPTILANNSIIDHPSPYASDHHHLLSPNLYKERETVNGSSQYDDGFGGFSAHNFFPLNSQFSVPNLPYNSNYFHLDTTPNLSLSQYGGGFSFSDHRTDHQSNCSLSPSQASSSQIYMSPSATSITPPTFPTSVENDHFRKINHLQNSVLMPTTLKFINSPIKSFGFDASLPSSQNEIGKQDQHNITS